MLESVKKGVYAAIGLAMMTGEKVEEFAGKITTEAKMTESQGRQFIDDLMKRSAETRDAMEKMIEQRVELTLKRMNISTQRELTELEERVRKIENRSLDQEKT